MNWTDYFLNIAKEVSKKSKDVHTQCGCILVHNNKIIGTGYNSFPRLMNDDNLPTTRPEKYDWMIHSERNALLNRTMIVDAFKAYMTTKPCFNCLIDLWQAGCEEITFKSDLIANCVELEDSQLESIFFSELIEGNPIITTDSEKSTIQWEFGQNPQFSR